MTFRPIDATAIASAAADRSRAQDRRRRELRPRPVALATGAPGVAAPAVQDPAQAPVNTL